MFIDAGLLFLISTIKKQNVHDYILEINYQLINSNLMYFSYKIKLQWLTKMKGSIIIDTTSTGKHRLLYMYLSIVIYGKKLYFFGVF